MSEYLHENQNYVVGVLQRQIELAGNFYLEGYAVVNKETHVTEYVTPSLPDAIFQSEQFNLVLRKRTWEWMQEEGDDNVSLEDLRGETDPSKLN